MDVFEKAYNYHDADEVMQMGLYPYFRVNEAAALAALKILKREPERLKQLRENVDFMLKANREMGYTGAELSWIPEDNRLINKAIQSNGGKHSKTYRVYEMKI